MLVVSLFKLKQFLLPLFVIQIEYVWHVLFTIILFLSALYCFEYVNISKVISFRSSQILQLLTKMFLYICVVIHPCNYFCICVVYIHVIWSLTPWCKKKIRVTKRFEVDERWVITLGFLESSSKWWFYYLCMGSGSDPHTLTYLLSCAICLH